MTNGGMQGAFESEKDVIVDIMPTVFYARPNDIYRLFFNR